MAGKIQKNSAGSFNREKSYFALTSDGLEEGIAGRIYIYRRWDKGFGAWRLRGKSQYRQFFPNWPLVNKVGNSILCEGSIPIFDDVPDDGGASAAPDLIFAYAGVYHLCSLGKDEYCAAFDKFVDQIPLPARKTIGKIGWCQWLLFDAIAVRPKFLDFLDRLIEIEGTGFVRACFILSRYWELNLQQRAEILDVISSGVPGRILEKLVSSSLAREVSKEKSEMDGVLNGALMAALAEGKESEVLKVVRDAPHQIHMKFRLNDLLSELKGGGEAK